MSQPKVFISYRHSDSQAATGRLYDRLNVAYPGLFFRDISGIGIGVDFLKELERAVGSSVALIAVIGPTWLSTAEDGRRRLDDPKDVVRAEIAAAIDRNIRIIPVLVNGASMPREDELPAALQPLYRWKAVQLVEEYYEAGIERLIEALRGELGDPLKPGATGDGDVQTRIRSLRGEAEAALAVEDWFTGVQALQAAVSLDPSNRDLAARLRWAHEQRKIAGLFAEGQELYEQGKKSTALARFRQVRVLAADYKNVGALISQLENELTGESRRSTVRRWTAGAIAAVCFSVLVVGAALVWVVSSEFESDGPSSAEASVGQAFLPPANIPSESATATPPPNLTRDAADSGADQQPRTEASPADRPTVGVGFPGVGRWRMTSQLNPDLVIVLALEEDGTFQVSMPAGAMAFPLSGGSFEYDDTTGLLEIAGMNNMGGFFNESLHVFERENDHFHVNYSNNIWELVRDGS